jgi:hypothetical protein
MNGDLQNGGFSVCLVRADNDPDVVCCNISMVDAAKEFWHRANNASAMIGIVQRVTIVDPHGYTSLAWEFGRGYTFDGKTFHSKPVREEQS